MEVERVGLGREVDIGGIIVGGVGNRDPDFISRVLCRIVFT